MINQMAALKCRCSASVCVSMHSCRRLKKTLWRRHEKETNPPLHRPYVCINRQLSHASVCVMSVLSSDVCEPLVFPSSASFVLSVPHLLSS